MHNIKRHEIAIIIPCKNEGIYVKQTLDFLLKTEAKHMADIFIIDDNSNDNCCEFLKDYPNQYYNVSLIQTKSIGAAQARNLGASLAAPAKVLVFCDAHITMEKNWLYSMLIVLENTDVNAVCPGIGHFDPNSPIGYGQTWNEHLEVYWLKKPTDVTEIPLAPGGCIAIQKAVFDAVGGFDKGFSSWGYEDTELSLKLWLFGYKIFVHPAIRIGHKFRKVQPYHVDISEFYYNKLRMAYSHFNENRKDKVISSMHNCPNIDKALYKLSQSDTFDQRADYFKRRVHDDDWFFNKFNIKF